MENRENNPCPCPASCSQLDLNPTDGKNWLFWVLVLRHFNNLQQHKESNALRGRSFWWGTTTSPTSSLAFCGPKYEQGWVSGGGSSACSGTWDVLRHLKVNAEILGHFLLFPIRFCVWKELCQKRGFELKWEKEGLFLLKRQSFQWEIKTSH